MAENTIKSRIQLKNDTEANWNKAVNFIPKMGEIIVYNVDDAHDVQRLKIGNGVNNVIDLPFLQKDLAAVATSGDYMDLINLPAVPGLITFNLTIPAEGWSEDTPHTLFIKHNALQQFNEPIVDVVLTGDSTQDEAILKAWFNISRMETTNGGIMVYANEIPEVEIPVHLKEILSQEGGNILQRVVLDHVPEVSEMSDGMIYFVPVSEIKSGSVYDQYMLIDGKCCSLASRVW